MKKNITLKLDEDILKLCKHQAVEANKSLSKWVADLLQKEIQNSIQKERKEYEKVKERALKKMAKGYNLGGKPLKREEIYDRKSIH